MRERLLAVARGDAEPDLVVSGARVFSAFTREWLEGDVAVADGRIAGIGAYDGGERIDAAGRPLVPGFIDAHVHLESAKLLPSEFARVTVARGTTAVVCDPHEIANVLGAEGALWLLDAAEGSPLRVFAMAPSCVPASRAGVAARARSALADMARILEHERAIGVAEVMDFPSVIAGDPGILAKVALHPHVDGHAPGVLGRALDAYAATGIASDHEATTWEEALEKRRRGIWVHAPRGLQRAQPRRPARARAPLRARVLRVLHGRPGAGRAAARRPHRRDVPDGGRPGDRARGRARHGLPARRPLPRARRPRRDRARLPGRHGRARRPRGVRRGARDRGRAGRGARRRRGAVHGARGARLGARHRAHRAAGRGAVRPRAGEAAATSG